MKVVFDTGSAVPYIYAKDGCCPDQNIIYDWSKSSTWRKGPSDKTYVQDYGNGQVEGYQAYDSFCLGPDEDWCFEIDVLAVTQAKDTTNSARHGLFGLSRRSDIDI